MRQEQVLSVSAGYIMTASGRKRAIGNRTFRAGDWVWTDGDVVFGNQRYTQPRIIIPPVINIAAVSVIPIFRIFDGGYEFGYFDGNVYKQLFTLETTEYYYSLVNDENNAYLLRTASGGWQQINLLTSETINFGSGDVYINACIASDGELYVTVKGTDGYKIYKNGNKVSSDSINTIIADVAESRMSELFASHSDHFSYPYLDKYQRTDTVGFVVDSEGNYALLCECVSVVSNLYIVDEDRVRFTISNDILEYPSQTNKLFLNDGFYCLTDNNFGNITRMAQLYNSQDNLIYTFDFSDGGYGMTCANDLGNNKYLVNTLNKLYLIDNGQAKVIAGEDDINDVIANRNLSNTTKINQIAQNLKQILQGG